MDLKTLIKSNGLKVKDIAENLEITNNYLSTVLSGKRKCPDYLDLRIRNEVNRLTNKKEC